MRHLEFICDRVPSTDSAQAELSVSLARPFSPANRALLALGIHRALRITQNPCPPSCFSTHRRIFQLLWRASPCPGTGNKGTDPAQRAEQTNQAKPSRKTQGAQKLRNLCVCSKQTQLLQAFRDKERLFVSLNASGEAAGSAVPGHSLEPWRGCGFLPKPQQGLRSQLGV